MTAFVSLLAGVAAAVQAANPGVPVHSNRTRPLSEAEKRAVFLRLGPSRRDTTGPLGATDWQTVIEVECAARSTTGADPALAADALLGPTWAALLGVPLALPDVLDLDSEPDLSWDFDAAETPMASATFRLVVRHRTQANTLTPWSA